MALHLIGSTRTLARDLERETPASRPMIEIMRPNTLIGVFPGRNAATSALRSIRSRDAVDCRYLQGAGAANQLRGEWRQRSLLRRLTGFSDEDRVLEDLARSLDGGSTIVSLHDAGPRAVDVFADACHVIRLGRWLARELR